MLQILYHLNQFIEKLLLNENYYLLGLNALLVPLFSFLGSFGTPILNSAFWSPYFILFLF